MPHSLTLFLHKWPKSAVNSAQKFLRTHFNVGINRHNPIISEISCLKTDLCDSHATCKVDERTGKARCVCNNHYTGDGIHCDYAGPYQVLKYTFQLPGSNNSIVIFSFYGTFVGSPKYFEINLDIFGALRFKKFCQVAKILVDFKKPFFEKPDLELILLLPGTIDIEFKCE